MKDNVISVLNTKAPSGISNSQFRRLDQSYGRAVVANALGYRTVNCDFDAGMMTIALYKSPQYDPVLVFLARKVGPQTTMYELYKEGGGRILKSTLFEKVLERYQVEIDLLIKGV